MFLQGIIPFLNFTFFFESFLESGRMSFKLKQLEMRMLQKICFFSFTVLTGYGLHAQQAPDDANLVYNAGKLKEVRVVKKRTFASKAERNAYFRLVYNMRVVYPYYKEAMAAYYSMNTRMEDIDSRREKRKLIKAKERYLKENFTEPLKGLTQSQGKLLVTLLERKTGKSCYELIKEYKSGLSAVYWQGLGKLFGYNIKNREPEPTDKYIDNLLKKMERENPIPVYMSKK